MTSTPEVIKYDQPMQAFILGKGLTEALTLVANTLNTDSNHIRGMALERALSIGALSYGDDSFHKDKDKLLIEIHEELADAIVYAAIIKGLNL